MIPRSYDSIDSYLKKGKVLVIFGPRQVGKTTLLKNFLSKTKLKYRLDSGEDFRIAELFSSRDFKRISEYAEGYDLIVIDEAQKIPNAGLGLKILIDNNPDLMIIATGSSSFELSGTIGEPLTGRKRTLIMFPIAQMELSLIINNYDLREKLEEFLVYGSYPEVITEESRKEKAIIIEELANSYLLKDIISFDRIKSSKTIFDLLRLLAFQIGSEVSLSEIGKSIGIDAKTVKRYIDILEKSFIILSLTGFSKNLRKEIVKKNKYYFYDTGIRNALISNFNPIKIRNDIGELWENFLFIERVKRNTYKNLHQNKYFWKTWNQQEIDYVEEREGMLFGYKFKYGTRIHKPSPLWTKTYENASFQIINRENYLDFIL